MARRCLKLCLLEFSPLLLLLWTCSLSSALVAIVNHPHPYSSEKGLTPHQGRLPPSAPSIASGALSIGKNQPILSKSRTTTGSSKVRSKARLGQGSQRRLEGPHHSSTLASCQNRARLGNSPDFHPRPVVKALGLLHKRTMDWAMRAAARNQVRWDRIWLQLEGGGQPWQSTSRADAMTMNQKNTEGAPAFRKDSTKSTDSAATNNTPSAEPVGAKDEPGYYYFPQILNHFNHSGINRTGPGSAESSFNITFGQYYYVSDEFYKPGGPIILWTTGETPLHSLILRRGLAYELANATSGLLVALEHRFYGSSIPRFQDTTVRSTSETTNHHSCEKQHAPKRGYHRPGSRHWAAPGAQFRKPVSSHQEPPEQSISTTNGRASGVSRNGTSSSRIRGPHANKDHDYPQIPPGTSKENGLPLDLLKFLTVDQAIEDIAYFIDHFQRFHFSKKTTNSTSTSSQKSTGTLEGDTPAQKTRWILAGCSYGGNLAAWTRQRYPSKVFAVFASSAPIRSTLDFFEYSNTQTEILGESCAKDLAIARDFLDEALQMTDSFMDQMKTMFGETMAWNQEIIPESTVKVASGREVREASGPETNGYPTDVPSPEETLLSYRRDDGNTGEEERRRRDAKLQVLNWFSPDFASEYALDGEEVHAAGWIWWTVASAVQYNAVVTPPNIDPPKTSIDMLCDTMAQARIEGSVGGKQKSRSDSALNKARSPVMLPKENISSKLTVQKRIRYVKALAAWFRDQQYFTPTKASEIQPSDLDPNSAQNLASMAWLWQTCSELGYLQTALPSPCCCRKQSSKESTSPVSSPSQPLWDSTHRNDGVTLPILHTINLDTVSPPPVLNDTIITSSEHSSCLSNSTTAGDSLHNVHTPHIPLGKPRHSRRHVHPTNDTSSSYPQGFGTETKSRSEAKEKISCKPCRCYADETKLKKGSVFSRLLTLEAAWQECQLYFGDAHSMQTQVPNSDERQQQQHDTHSTTNASTSNSVNWPFLQDYPDVESNVNRKFRSWEIAVSDELIVENNSATPPRIPSRYLRGDRFCESNVLKTSDKSQDSQSVKVLVIDQSIPCLGTQSILGTGDKTTKSSITSKTFIHSESTPLPSHVESTIAPPYPDSPVPKQKILQDRSLPINLAVNRNGGRYLTTEAAGTSERYYFTNGEKDPWIELTLAGTSAQEYLRAQRERDLHRHSRQPQEDEQIPEPRHTFNCGNPGSEHGCQSKDGEYTSKPPPKGPMEKQHRRKHYSGRQENMDPLKPPPVTHSPTSRRPQHSTLRDQPLGWPSHDAREGKDTHIQDQDRLDDTKQFKKRGFDPVNEFETVMRIIPSASHCQDILYESSDLDSNELRAERQHVIKTFVRWIELDKQLDLERGG